MKGSGVCVCVCVCVGGWMGGGGGLKGKPDRKREQKILPHRRVEDGKHSLQSLDVLMSTYKYGYR